ncbi:MAG: type II secretion system F family protein [Planctomycetota bacterium]
MQAALWILLALAAAAVLVAWLRQRNQRLWAQQRLASAQLAGDAGPRAGTGGAPDEGLARWLYLAGYRRPDAPTRFWFATGALALLGAALGLLLLLSGLLAHLETTLVGIPGRVGYLFVPIVLAVPVILPLAFAALPTTRVRRARRARVDLILRDLYPALELFASLAQAGLAFDAALARVLASFGADRPLGRELQTFQAEVMGGADRTRCFRRLAHRVAVPQLSSFTSALIRAHEVGIGLASTLRRQADELRSELRERALGRAQSLPSRLVFPLVLCFLPGVFVMSLGPAFYGFLVDTAGFGSTR